MKKGINILDFCEIVGLNLKIEFISRASRDEELWACSLQDTGKTVAGGAWTTHHALADSPEEAITKFCKISAGKTLTKSWGDSKKEKEIHIPKNIYYENYKG